MIKIQTEQAEVFAQFQNHVANRFAGKAGKSSSLRSLLRDIGEPRFSAPPKETDYTERC
jgi:hypothetical protein